MRIKNYFILRSLIIFFLTLLSYYIVFVFLTSKFPDSGLILQIILIPSYLLAYALGMFSSWRKYSEYKSISDMPEGDVLAAMKRIDSILFLIVTGVLIVFWFIVYF